MAPDDAPFAASIERPADMPKPLIRARRAWVAVTVTDASGKQRTIEVPKGSVFSNRPVREPAAGPTPR